MTKNSVLSCKFFTLVLLSALSLNAHGYTFTPEVGINIEQHSNIGRDASDQKDTVVAPYFGFDFRENNSTIDTYINFLATHEEYLDDTFSSLNLFNINAFVDWSIIPKRFVWVFEDVASTRRISSFGTSNPDNLQTVNVFSTGPDLLFQEGVWSLLGKLRVGDTNYSDSESDSIFISGSFAAQREINEYSRGSSGVFYRTNDFDADILSDYDIGKVFINYTRDLPSGQLFTGVGYSFADINSEKNDSEPYFKLRLSYQPTGSFTVEVFAVNEFTDDAGRAYDATSSRQTSQQKAISGLDELTSPGVYRSRQAILSGKYSAGLLSWDISALIGKKSFLEGGEFNVEEGTGFDTEESGVNANAALSLTDRMAFGIGGSYNEIDYPEQAANDEDYKAYASLSYRISRQLFTKIGVTREERKSNILTREFDDDVVYVSLQYKGKAK